MPRVITGLEHMKEVFQDLMVLSGPLIPNQMALQKIMLLQLP